MSSPAPFDSRAALQGRPTQTVLINALAVGDLIYVPGDVNPDPWRVRALDKFPGGVINVLATPGAQLQRIGAQSVGVYDGAVQTVKRVVL